MTADGRFLCINLHVSPRLDLPAGVIPADLTQFSAWQDWPATLDGARFTVHGLGPTALMAQRQTAVAGAWPPLNDQGEFVADSVTWRSLLPPNTPVIPHAFDDFRDHDVLTYPLAALADAIEAAYANLATSPKAGLPGVNDLINGNPLFASAKSDMPKPDLPALLAKLRQTDSVGAINDPDLMTALLAAYHMPLAEQVMQTAKKRTLADGTPDPSDPHEDAVFRTTKRVPLPNPDSFRYTIDFHRIVSAIGQHPALMRLAGLVVPLMVPARGVTPGAKKIRIEVKWPGGDVKALPDSFATTHATVTANSFEATPKTAILRGGWLLARSAGFDLVQLDVDGAGLSIKNFATQLPRIRDERFDDEGGTDEVNTTGTPRLRTAGIQFAQARRDRVIRSMFATAGDFNDKLEVDAKLEFHAEDLIRGWRVDILDEKRGKWRSLMRFDGQYTLRNTGQTIETRDEEAIARLGMTATADDNAPAALKKVLKASEALFGWAGWSLAAPLPGKVIMPDDVSHEVAPNTAPEGMPLDTSFAVHKGSLPSLRFANHYRVRLRSADLAGFGPQYTPAGMQTAGIESEKLFFGRYEPVETPVLTVINGDPAPSDGESMLRAALRSMDDRARETPVVRRNVHPARVAARFAETHGVLDDGAGLPRADLWSTLAGRDHEFPIDTVITEAWVPDGAPPAPTKIETRFTRSPVKKPTPYLADPLTGGAVIRVTGVPGIDPAKLHFIPFYAAQWDPEAALAWLEDRSFQIVGKKSGISGWDPVKRIFSVQLHRAERARLHISAIVPDAGIKMFKLREQILVREGEGAWRKIEPQVKAGQHWMFTPSRMVELVHAVQRPLIVPKFVRPRVDRNPAEVLARLVFNTPLHAKSTVRLDVAGDWIEIDDKALSAPRVRRVSSHAFDHKLARLDTPDEKLEITGNHVFADTRARYVTYRAVATTRFREYMPPDIRQDPANITVTSKPVGIWIPSATRPPHPAIRYVIPTFGWTRTSGENAGRRSWRRGGGLRVYLDRPWFASGSNEMLAVCLPRDGIDPANTPMRNHVTQWGADPAWISDRITTIAPAATHFPLRVRSGDNLAYNMPADDHRDAADPASDGKVMPRFQPGPYTPQGSPVAVDIVPHAVGYDDVRNLWYADIVVNPGQTYFPFVRLALARFQPASIDGHHLSAAVLADFAQLTPDRLAIVTRGEPANVRIIELYGHTPDNRAHAAQAGEVRVRLQQLPFGDDPDLGWVDADQALPPLSSSQATAIRAGGSRRRLILPDTVGVSVPLTINPTMSDSVRLGPGIAVGTRKIEAERLIDASKFEELLANPELLEAVRPPLFHRQSVRLPQRANGERLRLLVTEIETYETGPGPNGRAEPVQERIVYVEAIEV